MHVIDAFSMSATSHIVHSPDSPDRVVQNPLQSSVMHYVVFHRHQMTLQTESRDSSLESKCLPNLKSNSVGESMPQFLDSAMDKLRHDRVPRDIASNQVIVELVQNLSKCVSECWVCELLDIPHSWFSAQQSRLGLHVDSLHHSILSLRQSRLDTEDPNHDPTRLSTMWYSDYAMRVTRRVKILVNIFIH